MVNDRPRGDYLDHKISEERRHEILEPVVDRDDEQTPTDAMEKPSEEDKLADYPKRRCKLSFRVFTTRSRIREATGKT